MMTIHSGHTSKKGVRDLFVIHAGRIYIWQVFIFIKHNKCFFVLFCLVGAVYCCCCCCCYLFIYLSFLWFSVAPKRKIHRPDFTSQVKNVVRIKLSRTFFRPYYHCETRKKLINNPKLDPCRAFKLDYNFYITNHMWFNKWPRTYQ